MNSSFGIVCSVLLRCSKLPIFMSHFLPARLNFLPLLFGLKSFRFKRSLTQFMSAGQAHGHTDVNRVATAAEGWQSRPKERFEAHRRSPQRRARSSHQTHERFVDLPSAPALRSHTHARAALLLHTNRQLQAQAQVGRSSVRQPARSRCHAAQLDLRKSVTDYQVRMRSIHLPVPEVAHRWQ